MHTYIFLIFVESCKISINNGPFAISSAGSSDTAGIIQTNLSSDMLLSLFITLDSTSGNPSENPSLRDNNKQNMDSNKTTHKFQSNQKVRNKSKVKNSTDSSGSTRTFSTSTHLTDDDLRLGNFKVVHILYNGKTVTLVVPKLLKLTRFNLNKLVIN